MRETNKYTKEEIDWLNVNVPGHLSNETYPLFCQKFNRNISIKAFRQILKNHGIRTGVNTWFVKGVPAVNKGCRMTEKQYEVCSKTFFKKGNLPPNTKEEGYISLRRYADHRSYYWIKVKGKFKLLHRYLWEQAFGEIPNGKIVCFLDHNSMNCKIDNLILLPKQICSVMNAQGLWTKNPEINKSTMIRLTLNQKIRECEDKLKKGNLKNAI